MLTAELRAATTAEQLEQLRRRILRFRTRYLQVETALDFYWHAINSRTTPRLAALLRSCDILATRSMEDVLVPLRRDVPPVLTYVDKGLGASILRAGLRLWDGGSLSPAAAIKVTRQNLYRPTALIHETGHQVAHIVGWNDELAAAFARELRESAEVASAWSSWASEVAADTFAFAHTGYGEYNQRALLARWADDLERPVKAASTVEVGGAAQVSTGQVGADLPAAGADRPPQEAAEQVGVEA